MLQQFLDESLITLNDDAQFTKLTKAAAELVKKFNRDKPTIIKYALAAIDPNVSPENPEIKDAKEIIGRLWNTFASVAKDTPVTYLRGIILEAIQTVCVDIHMAAAVKLATRNIVYHLHLSDLEQRLIGGFLGTLDAKIAKEANTRFLTKYGRTSGVNDVFEDIKPVIDEAMLKKELAAASYNVDAAGVSLGDKANPSSPEQGKPWTYQFVPRAAKAIATVFNKAFTDAAVKNTRADFETLQIKTELLWWRFASYSNCLNNGYKDTGILGWLAMSKDYSQLTPAVYPTSIDYFLKQTFYYNFENGQIAISDFIKEVFSNKTALRQFLAQKTLDAGRITFYGFINALIWDQLTESEFASRVGFSANVEVDKAQLVLWLFQDMHIDKTLGV